MITYFLKTQTIDASLSFTKPRSLSSAKKTVLMIALALFSASCFGLDMVPASNCPTPTNIVKTSANATSISFTWDAVTGADVYVLKFVREVDGFESQEFETSNASFTFTDLTTGNYSFYFSTKCGGQASSSIVVTDTIM